MSDAIQDESTPLADPSARAAAGINASVQVLEELLGALHRITAQLDLLLGGESPSGSTDHPAVREFATQVGVEPADVYLALWCVVLQRLSGETSLSVDVQVSATDRVSTTIDLAPTDQIGELARRARAADRPHGPPFWRAPDTQRATPPPHHLLPMGSSTVSLPCPALTCNYGWMGISP